MHGLMRGRWKRAPVSCAGEARQRPTLQFSPNLSVENLPILVKTCDLLGMETHGVIVRLRGGIKLPPRGAKVPLRLLDPLFSCPVHGAPCPCPGLRG